MHKVEDISISSERRCMSVLWVRALVRLGRLVLQQSRNIVPAFAVALQKVIELAPCALTFPRVAGAEHRMEFAEPFAVFLVHLNQSCRTSAQRHNPRESMGVEQVATPARAGWSGRRPLRAAVFVAFALVAEYPV